MELGMGAWLQKYGESVYETRPWYTYGEGPTIQPEGDFAYHQEFLKIRYSWKDVRYTTRDDLVYATLLGWPGGEGPIKLEAFAADRLPEPLDIEKVTLMGSGEPVIWELQEDGLVLGTSGEAPDEMAVVFKIQTRKKRT